jgi:magnesium transporter
METNVGRAMIRTRLYRHGVLIEEGFPAAEISKRLAVDDHAVVWLDLCRPTPEDLGLLTEEFGLHQLAIEDAVQEPQRAKLDRYDTHLFLAAYAVRVNDSQGLTFSEVSAFITPRVLITMRKDDGFDIGQVIARCDGNGELARHGIAFLLHGLLDVLVDGHYAAVQHLDASIEELEDLLFDERQAPGDEVQRRSFALRRNLVQLRQVVLPMREVVNSLMRPTLHAVADPAIPYYQDVYDHILRVIERTESLRDLVTTVLEANLTAQSNQLNMIMKKVTSWAAIIAVPTAVTGFYGQNVPYPGYGERSGFLSSIVLTAGLAGLLYLLFRRKDWL